MTKTQLDAAYQAMSASEDEAHLAAYYGVLAASEVFVLLEDEAGETFKPQMLEMEGVRYVLAFDTDARMAEFCETPQPYIAMSGRGLVETLEGARLGVAVNPGFPTAMFVPPEATDWMRERTSEDISTGDAKIKEVLSPDLTDVELLKTIDARLAVFAGFSRSAYLVKAQYAEDTALLMIFVGIPDAARASVAGGLAEALRFVAPDLAFDTIFVEQDAPIVASAARVGLRFDMTPQEVETTEPAAPGSNPDKPPILH